MSHARNDDVHSAVASIRRADIRFVSPRLVRSAAVLERLTGWRDGLERVGVLTTDGASSPDMVVGGSGKAAQAVASRANLIVLADGRARVRRILEAAGYSTHRYLVRPSLTDPSLVLALEHGAATRFALTHATGSASGWRQARNAIAGAVLARGLVPPGLPSLTVGFQQPGPPLVVAAAAELGVPRDVGWFLTLGRGDQLSRNVFHLFECGSHEPTWVLKFVRVPGYRDPFDRDERALRLAAAVPAAAAHAPHLVGRFEIEEIPASLETAANGELLTRSLERRPRAALGHVQRIAAWIVELGRSTRAAPDALAPERARLLQEVIPEWRSAGAGPALVEALPPVPPVLQHNDLGCWNVVVRDGSFTALDWESARRHGLPLWDLAYFLTDAIGRLDRVEPGGWGRFVVSLFRGDSDSSPFLFEWIRRGVEAAGVPADAVGSILALGWMHHALSHRARQATLAREQALGYPSPPLMGTIAELWLTTPGLGSEWRRWQGS